MATEKALRVAKRECGYWRELAETLAGAVWRLDRYGHITLPEDDAAREQAERLLGIAREAVETVRKAGPFRE